MLWFLQEVMLGEYNLLVHTFQKTHHLFRSKNIKWQEKQSSSGNVILLRKTLFHHPDLLFFSFGLGVQCTYQKQPLCIFNIHLDDLSMEKRIAQLKEILPYAEYHNRIIIGGDFNENYKGTRSARISENKN